MTIGEPRPKSFKFLVGLGWATKGFDAGFLAGVSAGAGVAGVGGTGRLRFLDLLAGWFSVFSDLGGASLVTLPSTYIVSESEERFELLPKDGARLSDLSVVGAVNESACFILWTRGLSGYRVAGSEELDKEEKEWRSPGCFFVAECENKEEFNVEELGVEGLSDKSWLLDADFFGDGVGRAYGW